MRRHRGGTGRTTFRQTNCQLRLRNSGEPSFLSLRRQWILPPLKAFLNCLYHPYAAASPLSPGWRKAERCGREVVGFGRGGTDGEMYHKTSALTHSTASHHKPSSRTHSPHRISMHSRFESVLPLSKQFRGRS